MTTKFNINLKNSIIQKLFFRDEINKLRFDSNKTIADQIALAIGSKLNFYFLFNIIKCFIASIQQQKRYR